MISKYQELAKRTLASLGSQAIDGAHMALGLVTEVEEMLNGVEKEDDVNIIEEHGDCNWYIANECNIYNLSFSQLYDVAQEMCTDYDPISLGDIVDLHKKELAYGKEMDIDELENNLIILIMRLMSVCEDWMFTYEDSLQRNIDKLQARYPEKFTSDKALNRDLEKERKILEK